jgi:hypothetical protein
VALAVVPMVSFSQAPSTHELRVVKSSDGVVTTADRRVRCGAKCTARYKRGAVVALTASPDDYFRFERWSGGCVGTAPKCIIALDGSKTVGATFARTTGTVSMTVGGPGKVVSEPEGLDCGTAAASCTGRFRQGTTLRLTALPGADGAFAGWGGSCVGTAATTCDFVVGSHVEVSAAFGHAAPDPGAQTLTVVAQSGAHVVSVPAGIDCPQLCSASFASGTRVTLTLSAPARWVGGACVGDTLDCMIVVDETNAVTASVLAASPPPGFGVNVSVSGPGRVSGGYSIRSNQIRCGRAKGRLLDCEHFFDVFRTVTLRAVPRRDAHFARWRGFCSGKERRCTLRVTAPKTVLAAFRR